MTSLPSRDLWESLAQTDKTVVLYGMGNGADKILAVCEARGIRVSGVFASDGFARGNLFHGMPVRTFGETCALYGAENLIVLLSFGSSREEVLQTVLRVAAQVELYAPDVPAFGEGVFDRTFYEAHREELAAARALLSDEASRRIFDGVLAYKLTGRLDPLMAAESDMEAVWQYPVPSEQIRTAVDLGAYNGDTVREMLSHCPSLERVWAWEPDGRNFKRLAAYAEGETRARVIPLALGAWSKSGELCFDKSGNRNASVDQNRSAVLSARPQDTVRVRVDTVDHVLDGADVDYIKYDVEGSEREALIGSRATVARCVPTLMVSLYHRNEDLFALPLLIRELFPNYRGYYLRRARGIPAWDLNLYVTQEVAHV